jgi:hypothetical protein
MKKIMGIQVILIARCITLARTELTVLFFLAVVLYDYGIYEDFNTERIPQNVQDNVDSFDKRWTGAQLKCRAQNGPHFLVISYHGPHNKNLSGQGRPQPIQGDPSGEIAVHFIDHCANLAQYEPRMGTGNTDRGLPVIIGGDWNASIHTVRDILGKKKENWAESGSTVNTAAPAIDKTCMRYGNSSIDYFAAIDNSKNVARIKTESTEVIRLLHSEEDRNKDRRYATSCPQVGLLHALPRVAKYDHDPILGIFTVEAPQRKSASTQSTEEPPLIMSTTVVKEGTSRDTALLPSKKYLSNLCPTDAGGNSSHLPTGACAVDTQAPLDGGTPKSSSSAAAAAADLGVLTPDITSQSESRTGTNPSTPPTTPPQGGTRTMERATRTSMSKSPSSSNDEDGDAATNHWGAALCGEYVTFHSRVMDDFQNPESQLRQAAKSLAVEMAATLRTWAVQLDALTDQDSLMAKPRNVGPTASHGSADGHVALQINKRAKEVEGLLKDDLLSSYVRKWEFAPEEIAYDGTTPEWWPQGVEWSCEWMKDINMIKKVDAAAARERGGKAEE